MADVWTSTFFIEKTDHDLEKYPTNATLENLRENQPVSEELIKKIMQLAKENRFFHFHLEFPEVFENGGFNCLLGNPPWEQVQLEEEEWFSGKDNEIADTKNASKRTQKIEKLTETNIDLYTAYKIALDFSNKTANYIKLSGTYKYSTFGWLNTYLVFTERADQILSPKGFCGIIIPSGILSDKNSMPLFHSLLKKGKISEAIDYINTKGIFPTIHNATKFCAFSFTGIENRFPTSRMSFYNMEIDMEKIKKRQISVSYESLNKISPNTKNCLTVSSNDEYQLIYKIYQNSVIICNEDDGNSFITKQMFNISDKADQFVILNESVKCQIIENKIIENGDLLYYGVYESKMIQQFDHRFSTFENSSPTDISNGNSVYVSDNNKSNRSYFAYCRYYISKELTERFYNKHDYSFDAVIATRMISSPTNERTLIGSFVPKLAFSNSANLILGKNKNSLVILLANLNSFVCDFVCRRRMGGINLNLWNLNQLPIIDQSSISNKTKEKIIENTVRLSNTSDDLNDFFNDYSIISEIGWNKNLRFQLQCELDAIFFQLYLLNKDDIEMILETFPSIKRKDEEKYMSFRTKETILQLYDEFVWVQEELKQQKTNAN